MFEDLQQCAYISLDCERHYVLYVFVCKSLINLKFL